MLGLLRGNSTMLAVFLMLLLNALFHKEQVTLRFGSSTESFLLLLENLVRAQLVQRLLAWHSGSPGFRPQHCIKVGMTVHTCNSRTYELEAGGSEVQGYCWLHKEFKLNLGHMRPFLNNNKGSYINRNKKERRKVLISIYL